VYRGAPAGIFLLAAFINTAHTCLHTPKKTLESEEKKDARGQVWQKSES
jgi:hypothetical protein